MFEAKLSSIKNDKNGTHIKVRLYDTVVSVINRENVITKQNEDVNVYTRTLIEELQYTIAKDSAKTSIVDDLTLRMTDKLGAGRGEGAGLGYSEADIYVTL